MHADFLLQTLVLLGAIVLVVPLLTRLGLGSVPGYLIAGLLIGPPLLGWVAEYELIGRVAEFGVVFLLFSIGIELRPARLWVMRRHTIRPSSSTAARVASASSTPAGEMAAPEPPLPSR